MLNSGIQKQLFDNLPNNLNFVGTRVGWSPLIMLHWPVLQSGLLFSKRPTIYIVLHLATIISGINLTLVEYNWLC